MQELLSQLFKARPTMPSPGTCPFYLRQRIRYRERTRETEAIKVGSNIICREKPRREKRGPSWLEGLALSPPLWPSEGPKEHDGRPSPPATESMQMGNCAPSGSQRSAIPRGPRKPLLSSGESGELQGTQSSPTSKQTSQVRFPSSEASTYAGEGAPSPPFQRQEQPRGANPAP